MSACARKASPCRPGSARSSASRARAPRLGRRWTEPDDQSGLQHHADDGVRRRRGGPAVLRLRAGRARGVEVEHQQRRLGGRPRQFSAHSPRRRARRRRGPRSHGRRLRRLHDDGRHDRNRARQHRRSRRAGLQHALRQLLGADGRPQSPIPRTSSRNNPCRRSATTATPT